MSSDQSMASAFGAKITVAAPDHGLYLIMGRVPSVISDVRVAGGQPVIILPGGLDLLAMMPAASFLWLKGQPSVAQIGPVTIDEERFHQFLSLVGLQQPG
ncbi:MAG: hypothetical protein JNL34_07160 [Anaerolineae bacterium]|nr:hypothetical protein [Anaerolineae bacterium]